jgi:hypothetical protein
MTGPSSDWGGGYVYPFKIYNIGMYEDPDDRLVERMLAGDRFLTKKQRLRLLELSDQRMKRWAENKK